MKRREFLGGTIALSCVPWGASALDRQVWSVPDLQAAQALDDVLLLDIRHPEEWAETGLATGALPVSLHVRGFEKRLMAARDLAAGRPIALICATGGRSANLLAALNRAGFDGFVDVSEGMLGSGAGPGWIARGLPLTSAADAVQGLPEALR